MAKEKGITRDGVVVDVQRNLFTVEIDGGHIVRCTLSGKMRLNKINIVVGDDVIVELSPYEITKGRITRRG